MPQFGGKIGDMRTLIRLLGNLIGCGLNLLGLVGGSDQVATWSSLLSTAHHYFGNPFVYLALTMSGSLVLAVTWADFITERKLSHAGGTTRREFRANLNHWDRVNSFTLAQLQWLWNDLEPQPPGQATEGTQAFPTLRTFEENLSAGEIAGVSQVGEGWGQTVLSRQKLIDYALKFNQRPRFLFPDERHSSPLRCLKKLFSKEVPYSEAIKYEYKDIMELEMHLYTYLRNQTSGGDQKENVGGVLIVDLSRDDEEKLFQRVREAIRQAAWTGEQEAIGRRKQNGLYFAYEAIPSWKWEFIDLQYGTVSYFDEEYGSVKLRVKPHKSK